MLPVSQRYIYLYRIQCHSPLRNRGLTLRCVQIFIRPFNIRFLQTCQSTAAMARDTVGKFLKMMGTTLPRQLERSPVLADKVKAITRTWPFEDQIHRYIAAGTRMAEVTFSHFSDVDAIAAVAAYTILMFMLDDQDISHDTIANTRRCSSGNLSRDAGA